MSIKDLIERKRADPALHDAWVVADMAKAAGAFLRTLRHRTGMTQEEMAAALDVSQPRVSQLENGKVENMPPLDLMALYADRCGESLVLTTAREMDALVAERDALKAALDEKEDANSAPPEEAGRKNIAGTPSKREIWRSSAGRTLPVKHPHTFPSSKSGTEK